MTAPLPQEVTQLFLEWRNGDLAAFQKLRPGAGSRVGGARGAGAVDKDGAVETSVSYPADKNPY